jgi:KipI family sensor histidine kinase inhibitor
MIKNILNLGDAALYCDFGRDVNKETNSYVIKYFNKIKQSKIESINNIIPSYNKLIICFDLNKTNFNDLKKKIEKIRIDEENDFKEKIIEIPICCEEPYSLDFERLELKLKLNKEQILKNFFNKKYFCYMTGFIAGMPFLGDLDDNIRLQRLKTPRVKVPKGSVGITEQFANIYTFESPGGWNIIGNTPLKVFDNTKEDKPNLINPGDTVIFKKISKDEYLDYE